MVTPGVFVPLCWPNSVKYCYSFANVGVSAFLYPRGTSLSVSAEIVFIGLYLQADI